VEIYPSLDRFLGSLVSSPNSLSPRLLLSWFSPSEVCNGPGRK